MTTLEHLYAARQNINKAIEEAEKEAEKEKITELQQYCTAEKERAMTLFQSGDRKTRYNAGQAVNAWNELVKQLYRHKPINKKQFQKTKETALWIAGLMAAGEYQTETLNKIKALKL